MAEPDWQRVEQVLGAVLEITDPGQQKQVLQRLCGGDVALRAEVCSLLDAHHASTRWLEDGAHAEAERLLEHTVGAQWIGRELGAWRIEQLIGEGGMGAVYRVRRSGVDFEQLGALKIIRIGVESEVLVRRFLHERQALARLVHPGIARLLDGGTTEQGLPWLVMEHVDGEPIDQWCERQCCSVAQRVSLVEQVCQAVQHAHRNLIVHRDIKPSNILVRADGSPVLLDFGIAKLLAEDGADSELTVTHQRILTPATSSPEQYTGAAISTATDVYALGGLLYRLLTGRPPHEITGITSPAELYRLICEQIPTRPSLVEFDDDTARSRGISVERLRRALAGDLDTIIMKALRKEPERRYASAEALACDLQQYRLGEPVSARPDSALYRAGKFARRHWLGLAASAATVTALAVGMGVALWQADQARAERDRVSRINAFLQQILIQADPYQAGAEATVRDVLRTAGDMVGERFGDQPDLEAPLRHAIGYTQLSLMDLDRAEQNLRRADELNLRLYGPDDDRSLSTQGYLAWIEFRRDRLQQAEAGYRAVVARLSERHDFQVRANLHNEFGLVLGELERWDEALVQHRLALDLLLRHAPQSPQVGVLQNNIASILHGQGELAQARDAYERALQRQRRDAPGSISVDLAFNINNYAVLLRDLGETEAALLHYRESLDMRLATLGAEHAFTGLGHLNLGRLLLELGRIDEARSALESAVAISSATLEPGQTQLLVARASLARAWFLAGEQSAAHEALTEIVAAMQSGETPAQFIEQAQAWLEEAGGAVEALGFSLPLPRG